MDVSFAYFLEIAGIVVFTISGAFSAMQKRFDAFGVLIIGFVTSTGGGTIRDVLIGQTPVTWMKEINTPLIILVTVIVTLFFKHYIKSLKITLFVFDALGLGLFTITGIQKGINAGLDPGICIILGTITGSFGGVLRDILLNNIPIIFRKEIYATACIVGGIIYFTLIPFVDKDLSKIIAILIVFGIRIVAVRYNLSMPKFYA
ncbi:trimeric intracellular cation channel family protein [Rubrolithibacter danxiaensis]|uniref:trimeric intracellular cation channel family protein n=1 Tax=Rubrolithibacter danxiaensis TaxID=3390805 RepID=UPI003BF8AE65